MEQDKFPQKTWCMIIVKIILLCTSNDYIFTCFFFLEQLNSIFCSNNDHGMFLYFCYYPKMPFSLSLKGQYQNNIMRHHMSYLSNHFFLLNLISVSMGFSESFCSTGASQSTAAYQPLARVWSSEIQMACPWHSDNVIVIYTCGRQEDL
jgi:hypothetical protein